jgi:hypothetical protein
LGHGKAAGAEEQTVILKGDGRETPVKMRNGVILLPKGFKVSPRRAPRPRQGTGQNVTVNLAGLKDAPDYGPRAMTQRLVNALGNNAVAALLGVNKDRPGRWVSGQDAPNEENRAQLADLDALVGHLHSAFTPAQARLWLEGQDPHLGARPIDVYRLEGAAPVIEAIRAFGRERSRRWSSGAYSTGTPMLHPHAENGHPLYIWPRQGAGRVDDPDREYTVLYVWATRLKAPWRKHSAGSVCRLSYLSSLHGVCRLSYLSSLHGVCRLSYLSSLHGVCRLSYLSSLHGVCSYLSSPHG